MADQYYNHVLPDSPLVEPYTNHAWLSLEIPNKLALRGVKIFVLSIARSTPISAVYVASKEMRRPIGLLMMPV